MPTKVMARPIPSDDDLDFEIDAVDEDGVCRISVKGELDLATAPLLEAAVTQRDGKPVILDLSAVTFIDSTGLHFLLRRPESVTIAAVSPAVDRLIRLCGLTSEIPYGGSGTEPSKR